MCGPGNGGVTEGKVASILAGHSLAVRLRREEATGTIQPSPTFPAAKPAQRPFDLDYTCGASDGCDPSFADGGITLDPTSTAAYTLSSSVSFTP